MGGEFVTAFCSGYRMRASDTNGLGGVQYARSWGCPIPPVLGASNTNSSRQLRRLRTKRILCLNELTAEVMYLHKIRPLFSLTKRGKGCILEW